MNVNAKQTETTYNSLKPRTRGGVALYSLGNIKGSVIFMILYTGTEVAREKFHILPFAERALRWEITTSGIGRM